MATLVLGTFALLVKACYKTQCKDFSRCYGLIEIQRATTVKEEGLSSNRGDSSSKNNYKSEERLLPTEKKVTKGFQKYC
jgi:hypothetical protein